MKLPNPTAANNQPAREHEEEFQDKYIWGHGVLGSFVELAAKPKLIIDSCPNIGNALKRKPPSISNSHIPHWKLSSATKNIILDLLFCGACYAISGRAIIYQYDGAVRIALIHIRQQRSKTKGKKERYWGYLNFKMLGFYWQGPHGELQKDHRHSRLRNKQL